MSWRRSLFLLAGLLVGLSAPALESDRRQPVDIRASEVTIDEQQGFSEYTGNVVLTQGSLKVTGDRLRVYLQKDRLQRIVVEGRPATLVQTPAIDQPPVHAAAGRMEYDVAARTIRLDREAEVRQGPNRFRGEHLIYDITAARVKARAEEGRVHITIQPPDEEADTP